MRFIRRTKINNKIPTASMPDVVFQLLLFFMVSSFFKESEDLRVNLPAASQIEKITAKRHVAVIWVDRTGTIQLDGQRVGLDDLKSRIYEKTINPVSPLERISLRIDREVEMGLVLAIQARLREIGGASLNIHYSTLTEQD